MIYSPTIVLKRIEFGEFQTPGELTIYDLYDPFRIQPIRNKILFKCKTLEPPWKENQNKISCVPAMDYPLVYEYSYNFKRRLYELKNVPERGEVKIHVLNFVRQSEGCIGVGDGFTDIDKDGLQDITNSKDTLDALHASIEEVPFLTIRIINPDPR